MRYSRADVNKFVGRQAFAEAVYMARVKQQLPKLESGWFGANYLPTSVGDDERQMAFLQFLVADFPVREIPPRSLWTLLCKTIPDYRN